MAGRRRTSATQQRQSSILVWLGGGNGVDLSARPGHEQENGADARCRRRHVWPCCQRMRVSLVDWQSGVRIAWAWAARPGYRIALGAGLDLYRSNSLAKGMERMRLVRRGLTVLGALLVASAPLHGQTLGAHLPTDPQAPGAAISDASPAAAFDLDRAVAGVLEDQAALLLQRTRTRPARRASGGGNPTLAWAGVGMLAVGGILAINGAVSTCGVSVSRDFRDVSTSQCWTRAGVGAGVGALGAFLFMKNR